MKLFDLNKQLPLMKDCKGIFDALVLSYRVQGIEIPNRIKEAIKGLNEQIIKREGEER